MDRLLGHLQTSQLRTVRYGPGTVADLAAAMDERELSRALVVTGRSLGGSALLDTVVAALGSRCVGVFRGATQHVMASSVRSLNQEVADASPDVVISFGGSSVIDLAKAALASAICGREVMAVGPGRFSGRFDARPPVKHFALPTTLSAGEYNNGFAVTVESGSKVPFLDYPVSPELIINDPELTVETPDWLWGSTGIRAIDHAVEALYSAHGDSFTDALAVQALRLLVTHLQLSLTAHHDERVRHRGMTQTGAWLSNYAAHGTRYGLSHAVGHEIGPRWHIPHGVTSCVSLPASMRFLAQLAPERFAAMADCLDIDRALRVDERAGACADVVVQVIAGVGQPTRLRDLGRPTEIADLDAIVPGLQRVINANGSIGRDLQADELRDVVRAMW